MKFALIIGEHPVHLALIDKFCQNGIVIDKVFISSNLYLKEKYSFYELIQKIVNRIVGHAFFNAWRDANHYYLVNYKTDIQRDRGIAVESANSEIIIDYFKKEQPDLVAISGTDLLKRSTIEMLPTKTIINLHTGLSPYINGGPNCTNWSLSIGRPDLIGNTVMWIDSGIDSGNIISTLQTDILDCKSISDLYIRQFQYAHTLYTKCIKKIIENGRDNVKDTAQDSIGSGLTFYTREWNTWAIIRALVYYYLFISKQDKIFLPVRTINL